MDLHPLSAIRVFEAATRHLSFTRAAEELGMTQAGVSYQIRLLEERLGSTLFLRKPRGLELTALGARLAKPTQTAFDILRETYADSATQQETLSISALQTFAGNWLSQRIGRFQMSQPDLAVRIDVTDRMVDFAREDIDVAIRHGRGDWPGLTAHKLFDFECAPMMSPATLEEWGPLTEPDQIVPIPWVDPADPNWRLWLSASGARPFVWGPIRKAVRLGTQIHEARAAVAGEGVALLTPRFFRFELATGTLVQPFDKVATDGTAYWLVYPPARRNRPAIRAFRRFLTDEVRREAIA